MSSKSNKHYYVIDKSYLSPNQYVLKKAFVTLDKKGRKIWKTRIILQATTLKRMLFDKGIKLAENNKTRLLTGIKNNQPLKQSDYRKGVKSYELL